MKVPIKFASAKKKEKRKKEEKGRERSPPPPQRNFAGEMSKEKRGKNLEKKKSLPHGEPKKKKKEKGERCVKKHTHSGKKEKGQMHLSGLS